MTTTDSALIRVALTVIFVILTAYAAGRLHQWYRHISGRQDGA